MRKFALSAASAVMLTAMFGMAQPAHALKLSDIISNVVQTQQPYPEYAYPGGYFNNNGYNNNNGSLLGGLANRLLNRNNGYAYDQYGNPVNPNFYQNPYGNQFANNQFYNPYFQNQNPYYGNQYNPYYQDNSLKSRIRQAVTSGLLRQVVNGVF